MSDQTETNEFSQAKKIVYRLLKIRPRSEKELADKLKGKEISPDVIERTIAYFKKILLLDDRLFAKAWISSRLNKPFGLSRIRFELKQKGIASDIIEEESAALLVNYDEDETILGLAKRRFTKYKNLDKDKARRRLYNFLARRGFTSNAIQKIIYKV